MLPTQLLGALKTQLEEHPLLAGWTVYDTPQPAVHDMMIDISLSTGSANQFAQGLDGMLEVLYVRVSRGAMAFSANRDVYLSLWDIRDPITTVLFGAIESMDEVEILPRASSLPQWGEVYWTANDVGGGDLFLACEFTVPLDRRM